jgi:hypothetical protein
MTLYAPNGSEIKSTVRTNGNVVDIFQLPDSAFIKNKISAEIHRKLIEDPVFREKIERADKQRHAMLTREWFEKGCKGPKPPFQETIHLSLLRHGKDKMTDSQHEKIEQNAVKGEKIMLDRIKNESLERSKAGYEKGN